MKYILSSLTMVIIYTLSFGQNVTLYENCQYKGQSISLRPGRHNLNNTGFGAYKLSSIRVPSGLKAVLYYSTDPGSGPEKLRVTSDMSCLPSNWNDKTGSIVIENDNYTNNGGGNSYPSYNGGGSEQVMVYEDASFRGRSSSLTPGRYDIKRFGIGDDAMSSIRIPTGYKVTVYTDPKFSGSSQTFYSNVYALNSTFNDRVSSVIVEYSGNQNNDYNYNNNNNNNYQPPSNNNYPGARDRVYVYSDCQYRGSQGSLAPGRYNVNNMGVGNDQISSMRIPSGFRVTAYENSNFGGSSQVFTSDNYCIKGMWDDNISSIVVDGPGGGSSYDNQNYSPSYGNQGATVYNDSWFKGYHSVFGEGRHNLRNTPLDANITSVSLQSGYSIIAYDDYDFRGRSTYINGSNANLSSTGWSDKIRSFIIRRN